MKTLLVLFTGAVLTACTFGPNGICGPQTPAAYCDKDAYQRLLHPKPYIEYWEKAEGSDSERKRDSTECGGGGSDYAPSFGTRKIQEAKRVGETDDETRMRLEAEWRNCMGMKGYRFTRSY